jgi:hypothetical protein
VIKVSPLLAILAAQVVLAADERVPILNIEPGCRFAASIGGDRQTFKTCMDDEQSARAELEKGWSAYAHNDRERCVAETRSGANQSYVEVLECIVIARDAREMDKKERRK